MPKEEIAPGLFVGSEMFDLNEEERNLVHKYVMNGDSSVLSRIHEIGRRKREILVPDHLRRRKNLRLID